MGTIGKMGRVSEKLQWLQNILCITPVGANNVSDILWSNWLPAMLFGSFMFYCVHGILTRTPEQNAAIARLLKNLEENMNCPDERAHLRLLLRMSSHKR